MIGGDGSEIEVGITEEVTHNYAEAGRYQVKISESFPQIDFGFKSYSNSLISVDQWGTQKWTSMNSAFKKCENVHILAVDAPDLSQVSSLREMFFAALSMNESLEHWDVSNISDMGSMFYAATSYNQPLNSWNTEKLGYSDQMFNLAVSFDQSLASWNVTELKDAERMLTSSGFSSKNYELLLDSWSQQNLQNGVDFDAGDSTYCASETAHQSIIDNFSWVITDGGKNCQ